MGNEKLAIARNILSVTKLARTMETDEERVWPFREPQDVEEGNNNPGDCIEDYNEEEDFNVSCVMTKIVPSQHQINPLQTSTFTEEDKYVPAEERLGKFYNKYNRILLDCIAVDTEKVRLEEENAQLEDLIHQYLDGTKLTGNTLKGDNPLYVLNGRANLNAPLPVRKQKPTVQDAAYIISAQEFQMMM